MAPNLADAPPVPAGVEVWCCNDPKRAYRKYRRDATLEWTRWFNVHSERHMRSAYPRGYAWFTQQDGRKPIVLQRVMPDIPGSVAFPREAVMDHFKTRYFTFTGAWQMALAIYEGFGRIELYGFQLSTRKARYAQERPGFFWWVKTARDRGIELTYPAIVGTGEPGDADGYTGPLYGWETT